MRGKRSQNKIGGAEAARTARLEGIEAERARRGERDASKARREARGEADGDQKGESQKG